MSNPYASLPKRAFWKSGVAESSRPVPSDFHTPKWEITRKSRVATAGSCFAQHIGRRLATAGVPIIDVEPPPPLLNPKDHQAFGYSIYSARYGNIYTTRQLRCLMEEACGLREPSALVWQRGDRFVDALRPTIEPNGYSSAEVVLAHRRRHLERVASMVKTLDVFVFTLGLTEGWEDVETGFSLPVVPGTRAGGEFDANRHHFRASRHQECLDEFLAAREIIRGARGGDAPKFLVTVSPVPLIATARDFHVQVSTIESKSILRAVAGELAELPDVDYFPSYEIITSPWSGECFFESDMRSVRAEGVENVMRTFLEAYGLAASVVSNEPSVAPPKERARDHADDMAVVCDEELLGAFGS